MRMLIQKMEGQDSGCSILCSIQLRLQTQKNGSLVHVIIRKTSTRKCKKWLRRFMTMKEMLLIGVLFILFLKGKLKMSETGQGSLFGLDNKAPTDDGMDLIEKSWRLRGPSI